MGGISSVGSAAAGRPRTFGVAVQGMGVQAGGLSPSQTASDTLTSAVRIGTPLYKVGVDHFASSGAGIFGRLFHSGGAGGTLGGAVNGAGGVAGDVTGGVTESGLFSGGAGGTVSGGVGGAIKNGFSAFVGALKSNFLVSAAVSGITNLVELVKGEVTPQKAATGFAVDTAAYTGIGATSTMVGAALGSLIPIPFVGTAIGIALGMGLGFLYEKTVRQPIIHDVGQSVFHQNM